MMMMIKIVNSNLHVGNNNNNNNIIMMMMILIMVNSNLDNVVSL